jgi:hypothetical protein
MAIEIVFETHSLTVDNDQGRATGWMPGELSEKGQVLAAELGRRRSGDGIAVIGHVATRWGLDISIGGAALEDLVGQDFAWREGWEYRLG